MVIRISRGVYTEQSEVLEMTSRPWLSLGGRISDRVAKLLFQTRGNDENGSTDFSVVKLPCANLASFEMTSLGMDCT